MRGCGGLFFSHWSVPRVTVLYTKVAAGMILLMGGGWGSARYGFSVFPVEDVRFPWEFMEDVKLIKGKEISYFPLIFLRLP